MASSEEPVDKLPSHVKDVCKIGQGAACCRFLIASAQGFECAKHSIHAQTLTLRAIAGTMTARADNCKGFPEGEVIT